MTSLKDKLNRSASGLTRLLERFDGSWAIIGIFAACLIWATFMASVGWHNRLSDAHAFRQTQTAITSYYLVRGGPFLRYETPILGRPWSIPFEVPLYQWLVATISKCFHLQLEPSGRLISELFFGLSLVATWGVLSELGVRPVYRLVLLTLTLVSPQYIFWSRTFMIESTAFCFCMTYLYFFVRYIRTHKSIDAGLGGLFGVLGALVKVTTFPGFFLVGSLIYIYRSRHEYRIFKQRPKSVKVLILHLIAVLVFACLPVLVSGLWVQYTDYVKDLNAVATGRLTSSSLHIWNFGTLNQRFLGSSWNIILFRTLPDLLGTPISLALSAVGLFFARSRLVPFVISMAGFLAPFLIFINLHLIHDYYAYSNGIFLIAAVSWGIVGLLEGSKWRRFFGVAIFLVCIINSIEGYYERWYNTQKSDAHYSENLPFAIKSVTQEKDVLLIFHDWSAELPYYSERRALKWPAWMEQNMDAPVMREAIIALGDNKIGAAIFCGPTQTNSKLVQRTTSVLDLSERPYYQDGNCAVYPSKAVMNTSPGRVSGIQVSSRVNAANYGGAVDTVNCDVIGGWVWNGADPSEDIRVDISVDAKIIATVRANMLRPDLNAGTGNYGFGLSLPAGLRDGQPHSVSAKVSGSDYQIKVWDVLPPNFTCQSR